MLVQLESTLHAVSAWQAIVAIAAAVFFIGYAVQVLFPPSHPGARRTLSMVVDVAATVVGVALIVNLFQ